MSTVSPVCVSKVAKLLALTCVDLARGVGGLKRLTSCRLLLDVAIRLTGLASRKAGSKAELLKALVNQVTDLGIGVVGVHAEVVVVVSTSRASGGSDIANLPYRADARLQLIGEDKDKAKTAFVATSLAGSLV